jgi:hypothetical protein
MLIKADVPDPIGFHLNHVCIGRFEMTIEALKYVHHSVQSSRNRTIHCVGLIFQLIRHMGEELDERLLARGITQPLINAMRSSNAMGLVLLPCPICFRMRFPAQNGPEEWVSPCCGARM